MNLLLTEEEMYSLMETFKQCKIIPGVYFRITLIAFFCGRGLNVLYDFLKGLLINPVSSVITPLFR